MIGNIGPWQLLIVLVIVLLIFGTKKLRNLGGDLGGAVKGFKKSMSDETDDAEKSLDDAAESAEEVVDAAKEKVDDIKS